MNGSRRQCACNIDALVQRDRHGRPVIRASHLKGLLREAGEEVIDLLP